MTEEQANFGSQPQETGEEAERPEPQKPQILTRISHDKLGMDVQLREVAEETLPPEYGDIMEEIAKAGVIYGIQKDFIQQLCQEPMYGIWYNVAKGEKEKTGKDGELEYQIETERELRPKLMDDGTADFRDIGFIQNVHRDQILCKIIFPEKGDDGRDIFGNILEGRYGREAPNAAGRNTYFSEDKKLLLAALDGNIEVNKGVINVVELLRITGNVDNSTGNVDFVGDIIVSGDVLAGFKVISKGSIIVQGTVEGAFLEAEGDITINGGINARDRGSLVAGGSIRCPYIQSCFVKAGKNIYADSVMYCSLECGGDVELRGRRGVLIGGRVSVGGCLYAKTVGTDSHIPTQVNMFSERMIQLAREMEELREKRKETDREATKIRQILNRFKDLQKQDRLTPQMAQTATVVRNNQAAMEATRMSIENQIRFLHNKQMEEARRPNFIECSGRIHVGVQLVFGPLVMTVKKSFVYSRVHVVNNEITVSTLVSGGEKE